MEPLILVRFIHFAATLVAGGTVWFALLLPQPAPGALQRRLRTLTWVALGVAVLSGTIWLFLVAADILGTPLADATLWIGVGAVVTDTRFGQVSAVRLVLALGLALLVRRRRAGPVQGLLALGLVALPALTGHAGATPDPAGYGTVAADIVHLIAAGAWLGALPAFTLLLASETKSEDAAKITRRYGRVALCAVAALALSGLVNAWSLLSGPRDFIDTDYGRLLSLKLVLFAAMLAFAAVNRFHLTPALPAIRAQRALIRTTLSETATGLGVVFVVAILGTTPPGGHAHPDVSSIPADSSFVHIHTAEAMADVTIDPGRVGRVAVTIRLWHEDTTELPARGVRIAFDPPQNEARLTSEHVAVREPDGAWRIADIDLTQDGSWTVRVIITPREGSIIVLDAPVAVAR